MNVLEHTTTWYKGEIFEATIIGVFGTLFILIALAFWRLGKTPNTQAMVIPLLIVGLLLGFTGAYMAYSNSNKIKVLSETTIENNQEFVQAEKQRVEDFQALYTYTKIGVAICFAMAILIFFITEHRHWQAIAIALILIGASGLTIDYFSKERAAIYYQELLKIIG
ncbi:hypothetical protein VOI54_13875 [Tamlana sp. 2201CG12-4]|uniref:hypothetical protein n=1 Tax=Tamlana sp. 2201CG12-4 TaxID=3112582 RepID=UPI002DB897F3|nr:hypothetical protein [Tamlana sp. 2201CG12-4]MEC3908114.1 hypothetical protein [Tamlana sp. 2201CG12-4]